jgi:hypothetical protein
VAFEAIRFTDKITLLRWTPLRLVLEREQSGELGETKDRPFGTFELRLTMTTPSTGRGMAQNNRGHASRI